MTDTATLSPDLLDALNLFLNEAISEEGLPCPVTGQPVAITEWNAPANIVSLPGKDASPGYDVLPLTSPMGGVVLISVLKLRAWREKSAGAAKDLSGEDDDRADHPAARPPRD